MSTFESSHIATLHEDILIYIFDMNTQIVQKEHRDPFFPEEPTISALDTTRLTSQVCRSWREILLRSPLIWGNVIHLDRLIKASDSWLEELFRRTQEVRLSIYGVMHPVVFVLSLLDRYWHRVRRLDLDLRPSSNVSEDYSPDLFVERVEDIFWMRPAPMLEIFVVNCLNCDPPPDRPLFGGSAPSLRRLHGGPLLRFKPSEIWVPQLSSLTLGSSFTINDALEVLTHCSARLESLIVERTEGTPQDKKWNKRIYLPRLRRLRLDVFAPEALIYLSNISPCTDCALILWTTEDGIPELLDADSWKHIMDLARPYTDTYFDLHRPKKLEISLSRTRIQIYHNISKIYCGDPDFNICLHIFGVASDVIDIFETVFPMNLNTVLDLTLELCDKFWMRRKSSFLKVLGSLASVERVSMTLGTMRIFTQLPNVGHIFPRLTHFTVKASHMIENPLGFEKELIGYLSFLRDAGNPGVTLDIREYLDKEDGSKWTFLEQVDGLKVVYGAGSEYVCGQKGAVAPWGKKLTDIEASN